MMSPLIYELTVVTFIQAFKQLSHILKKGEEWADENQIPHEKLLGSSLAPDMKKLPYQIWTSSMIGKTAVTRLTGKETPPEEDEHTTFAQLQDCIARTLEFLTAATPGGFDVEPDKEITVPVGNKVFKSTAVQFLQVYIYPNFWFHVTTAYAILRSQGVPIGKMDFLGDVSEFLS